MKYGKYFAAHQYPPWNKYYIPYEKLKLLILDIISNRLEAENKFLNELQLAVAYTNTFYNTMIDRILDSVVEESKIHIHIEPPETDDAKYSNNDKNNVNTISKGFRHLRHHSSDGNTM